MKLDNVSTFSGRTDIPGDKSVSHRSLIFGAISDGTTEVTNLLDSGDVQSTESCLRALGAEFKRTQDRVLVTGRGLHGLHPSEEVLDCGNSGTTIRTMMGLLAGQSFSSGMTGDQSIQRRPMKRAAEPLRKMGAKIELTREDFAPITIRGTNLVGVDYDLKVASAQVKTALLLAGLYASGTTTVRGSIGTRDHTERMLPHFGVRIRKTASEISITSGQKLIASPVRVPGDPSSAAFWMGAASIVKDGMVEIENVCLNPTRTGFFEVLRRMGAKIEQEITCESPEPIGNIRVTCQSLRATEVSPDEIPSMVDEVPLLAIVASQAEGTTIVHGAEELRVKESDRLEAVATNLRAMGARIETFKDGYSITGPQKLHGAVINSFDDHRIAMSFAVASLIAKGTTEIQNHECVMISYPRFFEVLRRLSRA
ncbi:MAG: 3-phosphoshikimate 1-carboxyvinyltransferase [Bdellovibrionales bacterium RIFOXYC1_FULL_54_43]|nr:MAG: 3-phosphoshikimate 1-carboxyvinyltransferase [Bdellovibrionales bacterium RIFOXYC1_FULL_54_43]OFZ83249.1 MAG: 3-phosphoshikimate 1-carboxyvinyltransferase [Bdellovibrionales bacterium RIFOXYD1_FULL_55_31]